MKTTKGSVLAAILTIIVAILTLVYSSGCNKDDNRVLTPDQVKQNNANAIKNIENTNMPEANKKELESHLGGGQYSPGADAAKNHGAPIKPGGRQQ